MPDSATAGDSPSEFALTVQRAEGITTNQGDVNIVGGNFHVHHNYVRQDAGQRILSALSLVRNLRRTHLDILSKATPGTGLWFLRTPMFLIWIDLNGNVKILWGTGIRESTLSLSLWIPIADGNFSGCRQDRVNINRHSRTGSAFHGSRRQNLCCLCVLPL